MKIKKNILTNYSEQQLVSCTTYLGNAGCGGGWSDKALNYVKAKGICSSAEYPYVSGQTRLTGSCNTVKQTACTLKGPKIASVVNSGYGSCTNLVLAIDKHPVVVYVYAS
jgi:cathepsin L